MARSRSHGPIPAVERDLLGRRGDSLASRLPVLRAALEQQRRFRRKQPAQLDGNGRTYEWPAPAGSSDPRSRETALALREVDALVSAGARRALADIELASARMRTGCYGDCRSCGGRASPRRTRGDPQDHALPGGPTAARTRRRSTKPGCIPFQNRVALAGAEGRERQPGAWPRQRPPPVDFDGSIAEIRQLQLFGSVCRSC
jgi:RNA polymerase-binding transcription factor DksA